MDDTEDLPLRYSFDTKDLCTGWRRKERYRCVGWRERDVRRSINSPKTSAAGKLGDILETHTTGLCVTLQYTKVDVNANGSDAGSSSKRCRIVLHDDDGFDSTGSTTTEALFSYPTLYTPRPGL